MANPLQPRYCALTKEDAMTGIYIMLGTMVLFATVVVAWDVIAEWRRKDSATRPVNESQIPSP